LDGADKNKRFMLIVDHNVDDCFHTAMLLKHLGYTMFTAPSAQKALEIMSVSPPLAVFADAGDAGTALQAGIEKNPQFSDIPLIFLSNSPDAVLEERVHKGEFAGFLHKPVDAEKLFLLVESAIFKGPRQKIRILSALRADVSGQQGSAEGIITNISETGIFFRTLDPLPARSRLMVNFEIKGRLITLEAEVVYDCTFDEGPFREPGMGMKFVNIKPEDQAFIKAFILEDIETKTAR
jgi:CheY-like chemotaxis protein